jgi:hypothetical protein
MGRDNPANLCRRGLGRLYRGLYRAYITLYFHGGHTVASGKLVTQEPDIRRLNGGIRRLYRGGQADGLNKT